MKKTLSLVSLCCCLVVLSCSEKKEKPMDETKTYKPDSQELYDSIVKLDSIFFDAYNSCNIGKQSTIYSDSIEFYHDQGGLMTSKNEILESTRKHICGKVTRELIKGSIEVYPIKDYGAVEMGMHQFHNSQNNPDTPHPSKFVILWQRTKAGWQIARVVSLH